MRPASDSAGQERYMARWYENFLDLCRVARRRKLGIISHPSHKAALMDMIERVVEDPTWPGGEPPPLVFYTKMPPGQFQFIDMETSKVLTMSEAVKSNTGYGRYRTVNTPDAALRERN